MRNPFEYNAANNLQPDEILDFYIEDFNYSRLIQSTRNVFLIGERGSGKTMTLLHNSFPVQKLKAEKSSSKVDLGLIGVYVPCNTPLTYKKEYLLLNDFKASVVSEHFFVLQIIYELVANLLKVPGIENHLTTPQLQELKYILGIDLPEGDDSLRGLHTYIRRELVETQKQINREDGDGFYDNAVSFSSSVMPLIEVVKQAPILANSHFLLMIDDAHDLNQHQVESLNSWIAYRDRTNFSFKVATSKVGQPPTTTASGGNILQDHDFIEIDMERPFQNRQSDFGNLARQIVRKRLLAHGIDVQPEDFFPMNPTMAKEIEDCKAQTEQEAKEKYGQNADSKKIRDYVYKYGRVKYFRQRKSKANNPPYSGFETLVHISTGVVRHLLSPCYWMYDKMLSMQPGTEINEIPPKVQSEIILAKSGEKWKRLEEGLDRVVEDCTKAQAKQLENLFKALAQHFRVRLREHKSEPRAITFTISGMDETAEEILRPLLNIARKAQYLYTRLGRAKDDGAGEMYYVPNRLLLPFYGLDPVGQHARVSLKAKDLISATRGKELPFDPNDENPQHDLF